MAVMLLVVLTLFWTSEIGAQQADSDNVRNAVVGLYEALSTKDADGVVRFMLPGGYTEFSESGGRLSVLDQEYIRNALESDVEIDLRVQELEVSVYGDAAVATGYRVGAISWPGGTKSEATLRLSMMWVKESGKWKLVHVHLSTPTTS